MTFAPRRRSCRVLRLRACKVLRNPRPKALRRSRPAEGANNSPRPAPIPIPASNHRSALLASDCRSGRSKCEWFVMSGFCCLRAFFNTLAGTPLIRAARRLGFGTARSNFLLPLHFLPRTPIGDALLVFPSAGVFAAHLPGLSSAHGGTIPSARAIALLVGPHTRLAAACVL